MKKYYNNNSGITLIGVVIIVVIIILVLCLLIGTLVGHLSKDNSTLNQVEVAEENSNSSKNNNTLNQVELEEDNKEQNKIKTNSSKANSNSVANLGEKYVDLDNRCFAINGKVYTLGVSTLQEMIDDGVPFNENDIKNANNNLNANYESERFRIVLGEYYTAQVRVINDSGESMNTADCKLSYIYLPVHEDEEQNILSFAFPLTITEEELVAQAGEPTDQSEYTSDNYISRTIKYETPSTKYYGETGYTFEFVNGDLRYVTIDYEE